MTIDLRAFISSVVPGRRDRTGPHDVAFFDALRRMGFVLGQNLSVDGFGVRAERFPDFARELVRSS